eukprot:2064319-Pleurochrysis_carterae.AAC.1
MLYHGKVLALAYVRTFTPRPDKMYSSLPPSPPASERSYTEPGPDGEGSLAYHSLAPPDTPRADNDDLATSSPEPWRHAQHASGRTVILRQLSGTCSSSSPDEISGSLPTTPFGAEPRVSFALT